jgi:hypothetical protein
MQSVTTWKKAQKKQRSRIFQAYENKNILHTWRWPCRPKHVVKDSENHHNEAIRRRKHNLQNRFSFVYLNSALGLRLSWWWPWSCLHGWEMRLRTVWYIDWYQRGGEPGGLCRHGSRIPLV